MISLSFNATFKALHDFKSTNNPIK